MSASAKIIGRRKSGTYQLTFPPEVDDKNYMILKAMEKSRDDLKSRTNKTVGRYYTLPIPAQLTVNSKVEYEAGGIGAFAAAAAGRLNVQGAKSDITNMLRSGYEGAKDIFKVGDVFSESAITENSEIAGLLAGGAATLAAGKLGSLGTAVAGAVSVNSFLQGAGLQAGLALNPHMAVLFKSVGLRTFGFQYKFIARNQQESNTIRDIITTLKYHMHPEFYAGNLAFKYPDSFEIDFSSNRKNWLFTIKNSVLTDLTVNYNGENMPIFFEDVGAPVSIDIQMTFQETEIFTKADYPEQHEVDQKRDVANRLTSGRTGANINPSDAAGTDTSVLSRIIS